MYRQYKIILFLIIITINYPASIIGATVNYDNVKLNRAEIELKKEELISVGILIFDPNVPEGEVTKHSFSLILEKQKLDIFLTI